MTFARTTVLALLLLGLSAFSTGCTNEDAIGVSSSNINGRPFFELFEAKDGEYYFNLVATNHEVVLSSEGYTSRTGALSGILSVLDNGGESENFELREAVNGQFYFVLKAGNGQIIGMSELYSTKGNATRGIGDTADVTGDYLAFLATRKGARFTVFEGTNGLYYFNLKARNGQIVLQSQAYSSESAAMNATFAVSDAGVDSNNYDIKTSADGGAYFNLRAGNNEIIGTSEIYYSKSNARRARNSVMALLPKVEML